ncbi:hypothetical protein HJB99_07840 [Rhizobium sp. NLR17b]|nr:hypothetical protein [Rhizobium sp. NLR17b]MBX5268589.1 hypothetical protein [Rhizobium sp. NLR17b]
MDIVMHHIATIFLTVLMVIFLSLGFYGLVQHASKQISGSHPTLHQVR